MKTIFSFLFVCMLFPVFSYAQDVDAEELAAKMKKSVVKIEVASTKKSSFDTPWSVNTGSGSSGSGFIINLGDKGSRIMTNAHVVSDALIIKVKVQGSLLGYIAKVEYIGYDTDLAILNVVDETFYNGLTPIPLSDDDFPKIGGGDLEMWGFPSGGTELSMKKGVYERMGVGEYVLQKRFFLRMQIQISSIPGGSGGPIVKNGKLIGVTFQNRTGDPSGYAIPSIMVKRFLKDIIDDEVYNGIPDLGIRVQEITNPYALQACGMKAGCGVLVRTVGPDSSANGHLNVGDIITRIDDKYDVSNEGTILLNPDDQGSTAMVEFTHAVSVHQIGEILIVNVTDKEGNKRVEEIPLKGIVELVPGPQYDKPITYYINGGVLFEPLTYELLEKYYDYLSQYSSEFSLERLPIAVTCNYYSRRLDYPSRAGEQVVVIPKIYSDEVNVDQEFYGEVTFINGKEIHSVEDVITAFDSPVDGLDGKKYNKILVDNGITISEIVLPTGEILEEANTRIMNGFNIPSDRSDDLK